MNKKGTIIPLLYYYSLKMNNTKNGSNENRF